MFVLLPLKKYIPSNIFVVEFFFYLLIFLVRNVGTSGVQINQ